MLGTGVSSYLGISERTRAREAEEAKEQADASAKEARGAEQTARRAESRADEARQATELQAAELLYHAGLLDAENGLADKGLFTMLAALRRAPADAVDFRRVVRTNLSSWSERLPVMRQVLPNQSESAYSWFLGRDGRTFATVTRQNTLQLWSSNNAAAHWCPERPETARRDPPADQQRTHCRYRRA